MRRQYSPVAWLVVALAAASCGYDNTAPQNAAIGITKAAANNGDAQSGTVGTTLAIPLRVQVTTNSAYGQNAGGQTITWAAANGGSMNPTTSATNADGVAVTTWTLGPGAGAQTATATLSGANGSPVTFNATATP